MLSHNFSVRVEDVPRLLREAFLEELLHTHLPDEAESLTVLALRIRQSHPPRDLAHLRLRQVSDRKDRMRELELIESREEIGLVFIRIESFEEVKLAPLTRGVVEDRGVNFCKREDRIIDTFDIFSNRSVAKSKYSNAESRKSLGS